MTKRRTFATALAGLALIALLLPEPRPPLPEGAGRIPFVWDRDDLWKGLEQRFASARQRGCDAVGAEIDAAFEAFEVGLAALASQPPAPDDDVLRGLEATLFEVAPLIGACPDRVDELVRRVTRLRARVKDASRSWDMSSRTARDQVYRLLYGGRAAVEEVLLQLPRDQVPALTQGTAEPSATPSAEHHGVRIHSGDVLVSRGGAPTSALIARGNDYPGNFSHIALLHVDAGSRQVTVVESHIEEGVVLSSLDDYLGDTKLRIMVLRLRSDLPALVADPQLPHRVAERAVEETRRRHIPYDFEMAYRDPAEQFCSEVASAFYAEAGIDLWQGLTSMSSRGVTRWLSSLGVRFFETHGPSDLEYDPQLRVVAEWRDPETLYQDHLDNAVIDVLLEGAEAGEDLEYSWPWLPASRLAKLYSATLNLFGGVGPIPQGMSATVALRVRWLGQRHAAIRRRTVDLAGRFAAERGYAAPYWQLVRLARQAKAEIAAL